MEKKRGIEIGIAVIVVVALGILIWWILARTPQIDSVAEETPKTQLPTPSNTSLPATVREEDIPQVQEVSASAIARTFVERIGSYSSESDYQNIDDVLGIVTDDLAVQLKKSAEKSRNAAPKESGGYYGISTAYVGAKTDELSDAKIMLTAQTQREEAFGSPKNSTVRYQSIKVTLVKEGTTWKISAYTWL